MAPPSAIGACPHRSQAAYDPPVIVRRITVIVALLAGVCVAASPGHTPATTSGADAKSSDVAALVDSLGDPDPLQRAKAEQRPWLPSARYART